MQGFQALLLFLSVWASVLRVEAHRRYEREIPNADVFNKANVRSTALGHRGSYVSGTGANRFGLDYESAGRWKNGLCEMDSDGDGFSNGEELGDPSCNWNKAQTPGALVSDPTNSISTPLNPVFDADIVALIYSHAALMAIAWLCLIPLAIMQATVYKKSGGSCWFKTHKYLNIAAVLLTVIAVMVMFFAGPGVDGLTRTDHGILGTTVTIGAIFQAISGYCRIGTSKGQPKSFHRLLWEFQHQWLGRVIFLCALGAIYTGLPYAFLPEVTDITDIVLLVLGLSAVVLSVAFVGIVRDGRILRPFQQVVETPSVLDAEEKL